MRKFTGRPTRFEAEIASPDEPLQGRTLDVMLQPTKAGDTGAPPAGRSGLYLFGFMAAAVAIREGLVMASSRKHSLSRASLIKPSSRTIAATVRRSSSARRAMREQVS